MTKALWYLFHSIKNSNFFSVGYKRRRFRDGVTTFARDVGQCQVSTSSRRGTDTVQSSAASGRRKDYTPCIALAPDEQGPG